MMKMKIYKSRVELESLVFCPKKEQTFFSEFSYNTDFFKPFTFYCYDIGNHRKTYPKLEMDI